MTGIEPLAVNATTAAKLIGISKSTFYSMVRANKMPVPRIEIGLRHVWRVADIERWIYDGCSMNWKPTRSVWDRIIGE